MEKASLFDTPVDFTLSCDGASSEALVLSAIVVSGCELAGETCLRAQTRQFADLRKEERRSGFAKVRASREMGKKQKERRDG